MKRCLFLVSVHVAIVLLFFRGAPCFAQTDTRPSEKVAEQAEKEYAAGKFAEAERDFRGLTKLNPSDIGAQLYLGHALFRQGKYAEAVEPYEKARDLEKNGKKLSLDQHRILIDQLAIAYGISGNLKKAHGLLDDAIRQDPATTNA